MARDGISIIKHNFKMHLYLLCNIVPFIVEQLLKGGPVLDHCRRAKTYASRKTSYSALERNWWHLQSYLGTQFAILSRYPAHRYWNPSAIRRNAGILASRSVTTTLQVDADIVEPL